MSQSNNEIKKFNPRLKTFIISFVVVITISILAVIISTIITVISINNNLPVWKDFISQPMSFTPEQRSEGLEEISKEINKYDDIKLAKHFVSEYDDYSSIKDSIYDLIDINYCYTVYKATSRSTEEIENCAEKLCSIYSQNISKSTFTSWYNMYNTMLPKRSDFNISIDTYDDEVTVLCLYWLPVKKLNMRINYSYSELEGYYYKQWKEYSSYEDVTFDDLETNPYSTENVYFSGNLISIKDSLITYVYLTEYGRIEL